MSSESDILKLSPDSDLEQKEFRAAVDITATLLMAVKSYGLFPPDHTSTQKMIGSVLYQLRKFVRTYGDLKLEIEKKRLLYLDEVVFEEENPEENPAFIFFRDGIRWIEFEEGLTQEELVSFFHIVNFYKDITSDEKDGDIVTALWSADLDHIQYEASDELWEAEPVLEFSLLNPAAQDFLEQGGGVGKGFDFLKSMLGIEPGKGGAGGKGSGDQGAVGDADGGGPNLDEDQPGTGMEGGGGVGGPSGATGSGESTDLSAGQFDEEGDGLGEGDGGGEAEEGTGNADDLDFWNKLTGTEESVGGGAGSGADKGAGSGSGSGPSQGPAVGSGGEVGGGAGSGTGVGVGQGTGAGVGPGAGAGGGTGNEAGSGKGPGLGSGDGQGIVAGSDPATGNEAVSGEGFGPGTGAGQEIGSGLEGGAGGSDGAGVGEGSGSGSISGKGSGVGKGFEAGGSRGAGAGEGGTDSTGKKADPRSRPGSFMGGALPKLGKSTAKKGVGKASKGKRGPSGEEAGSFQKSERRQKGSVDSRPGLGGDWESIRPSDDDYISVSVASIEVGETLWSFSQEEKRTLDKMVKEYEGQDNSSDVTELLMFVLRDETEPHIFQSIINFMREEFRNILVLQDFRLAYALLNNLKDMRDYLKEEKEWALPILDKYYDDIAEPEIMDSLMSVWSELQTFDDTKLKTFAALMQMLPPKTGESLVPMYSRVESEQGRRIMVDMIASFLAKDLKILEKMLARPEEEITLRLINVLKGLPDHNVAEALTYKVIHHPKDKIRKEALGMLVNWRSQHFEKMFQMIHDSNPDIRLYLLEYLGDQRRTAAESILREYMNSDRFMRRDPEHILACYRALGRCGTDESVSFLENTLFSQPWNFIVGYGLPIHRQGAALALKLIKTPGSIKLFNRAAKSSVPYIKGAWQKANADSRK